MAKKQQSPNIRCKAYKFRLYPTRKQIATLEWTLRRCKGLYNAALQERRDAYHMAGVCVSYEMQAEQLPAIKQLREEYQDLQIENMVATLAPKQDEQGKYLPNGAAAKGGLNKSMLDAGWGAFVTITRHKAEEAGGTVVKVAPHDTSQACSGCGAIVKKDLSVRWHSCPHCGRALDRDHNAALNILGLRRSRCLPGMGRFTRDCSRTSRR